MRAVTYTCSNLAVARADATGYVTPAGNGSATVRIERGAECIEVPVRVTGAS